MPIPSFDIWTYVYHQLPPNYRLKKWIAAIQSFLYGLMWRMGHFLEYMNGNNSGSYASGTSYEQGDRVCYNYAVYESLIPANIGNTPDIVSDAWIKINDSFIGAKERVKFGGGRIGLEWALNRQYKTVFRQPDDPVTPTLSDIYIANDMPVYVSFAFSAATQPLGGISTLPIGTGIATVSIIGTATSYKFVVNIPAGVYAAIDANPVIAETIVRKFLDAYAVSGVYYSIATY